jgi:hypothetical protein
MKQDQPNGKWQKYPLLNNPEFVSYNGTNAIYININFNTEEITKRNIFTRGEDYELY